MLAMYTKRTWLDLLGVGDPLLEREDEEGGDEDAHAGRERDAVREDERREAGGDQVEQPLKFKSGFSNKIIE